jgi:lantibiotic modifying enzyme
MEQRHLQYEEIEKNSPSAQSLSPHMWKSVLPEQMCHNILQMITCVAERLSHRDVVLAATQGVAPLYWLPYSLTSGFPSLALLFLFFARATGNHAWYETAQIYLKEAADATNSSPLKTPSLSRGTAGFAFLLALFAEQDDRYSKAAAKLDQQLANQVLNFPWERGKDDFPMLHYDVISGASGVLRYLVTKKEACGIIPDAIEHLLQLLVTFARRENAEASWALPASSFVAHRQKYGMTSLLNYGLAHGLPGPLAALSFAAQEGYQISGQHEAIARIANALVSQALSMPWGIDWPDVLPPHVALNEQKSCKPARSGWCYGAPGVVRSLWIAGHVLHSHVYQEIALQGMQAILKRPPETQAIDPLTLCHGIAGLMLICLRFLHETKSPEIHKHIPNLVNQIIQEFHPELPFGFRYTFKSGIQLDSLGVLTGVSGTMLALLATISDVEPQWDRALLLS